MKYFAITLILLVAFGFVTPFQFTSPSAKQKFAHRQAVTVSWTGADPNNEFVIYYDVETGVDYEIHRQPAGKSSGSFEYLLTYGIDPCLAPSDRYYVCYNPNMFYCEATVYFTIESQQSFTVDEAGKTVAPGDTVKLRWTGMNEKPITASLLREGQVIDSKTMPNDGYYGEYNYELPSDALSGTYTILFEATFHHYELDSWPEYCTLYTEQARWESVSFLVRNPGPQPTIPSLYHKESEIATLKMMPHDYSTCSLCIGQSDGILSIDEHSMILSNIEDNDCFSLESHHIRDIISVKETSAGHEIIGTLYTNRKKIGSVCALLTKEGIALNTAGINCPVGMSRITCESSNRNIKEHMVTITFRGSANTSHASRFSENFKILFISFIVMISII
jgi:hypothetical protein